MNSKQTEADYVPYGPEWEKEMSKFPKLQLIKMLGKAYQEKKELKQSLPSKPVGEDATVTEQEMSSLRWLLNVSSEKPKTQLFTALDNCCDKEGISNRTHLENLWNKLKSGYAAAPQKGMKELFNKLKREFEFVGDEKISGITALRLIKPIFDESPSPSEAGDEWISVEDGLPQDRERVLVFNKYTRQIKEALFIKKDEWDRDNQFIIGGAYYDIQKWITHWRPLPAPPIQKTVK